MSVTRRRSGRRGGSFAVLLTGVLAALMLVAGCGSAVGGVAVAAAPSAGTSPSASAGASGQPTAPPGSTTGSTSSGPTSGPTSSGPTSSAARPTEPPPAQGNPDAKQKFVAALSHSMAGVTSIQGTMNVSAVKGSVPQLTESAVIRESIHDSRVIAFDATVTMTIQGQDATLLMRMVDGKTYMGGDLIMQALAAPAGKHWALVDQNSSDPALAQLGSLIGPIVDSSGPALYAKLGDAITEVADLGPDTVAGVPATHYRVTMDAAKAAEVLGVGSTLGQQMASLGSKSVTADEWLDAQGRMVKTASTETAQGVRTSTEMVIDKFNAPVAIAAPDAASVFVK